MSKTLLKHYIYEYCIEVAFNAIRKNFPISQSRFYVGQEFDLLEFAIDDIWWSIEFSEVVHCDNKVLVLEFASCEVHIPSGHDDVIIFSDSNEWGETGTYGDEMGDSYLIYLNQFGGRQVFSVELLQGIEYV